MWDVYKILIEPTIIIYKYKLTRSDDIAPDIKPAGPPTAPPDMNNRIIKYPLFYGLLKKFIKINESTAM